MSDIAVPEAAPVTLFRGRPSKCGRCGTCARCLRAAYMRGWYRREGNAEKQRQSQRESRQRRLAVVQAYDRKRGFRVYSPEAARARRAVGHAVRDGRLNRQPCEVCGVSPADAHHDDYSRPLDVRWLCEQHHGQAHRQVA